MAAIVAAPQGRYATLDTNLGLLQEMVRKDPQSYREEFEDRFFKFEQRIHLFDFDTVIHRKDIRTILDLVTFISGVANNFPEHGKKFAGYITKVLLEYGPGLEHDVRMSFTKAMVALRNKKIVTDAELFEVFFDLIKCEDKNLRKFILGAMISFIKQKSQKCSNKKEESAIQNLVISKLKDARSVVARIAQLVLIDAFRKKYWRIPKIANAIADCVFHKVPRLQVVAMRFFLGSMKDEEGLTDDSDEDDENDNQKTVKDVMVAFKATKKTKKRLKNLEKTKKALTKDQKAKKESRSKECNFEALLMLYDPQTFCDKLFGVLESKKNEKFVVRIQQIALCARVIGIHRLQTLGFYSYMHRYLQPKQREVTRLLLYITQSCHELVPPEYIQDVVRVIADNFVSDRNTAECMTVGLNTIREIFTNCPFAAQEDLVQDLTQYKSYKNKNVSMAARGIISLFRTINPKLLARKDRGRPNEATEENDEIGPTEFGGSNAFDFVPGAEVLPENIEDLEDEVDEKNSDSESDSEWETVSHSGDEIENEKVENDYASAEDDDDEGDSDMGEDQWVSDDEMDGEEEVDADSDEELAEDGEDEWVTDDENEKELENSKSEVPKKTKQTLRQEKQMKKVNRDQVKLKRRKEREEQRQAKLEKAKLVSETRILSDADFKKIRVHQLKKKVGATDTKRKRTLDDERLDEEMAEKRARRDTGGDGLQRLNDIVHFYKKLKTSKEEKVAQAEEGREDRDFFKKPKKNGPHVGRNKYQVAKNKDFRMVRQKIRGKNRQQSFRDRQKSLRNYLLRQAGRKPGNK